MNVRMIVALCLVGACVCTFNISSAQEESQAACEKECSFLTKDCQAYIDCRVAKGTCLENCLQRKVWEKVAGALDRVTAALEAQTKERKESQEAQGSQPTGINVSKETPPPVEESKPAESMTMKSTY